MITTTASSRKNPQAINDSGLGSAQELLRITESAVDALSPNRSRSGFTNRDQKSDSSAVNTQARNRDNVNLSTDSSTASEILRRSTHTSAAFGVPVPAALLPQSSEAARFVRIPVKVLREVPLHDVSRFSGSSHILRDHRKEHPMSERKTDQLVNADQFESDGAAGKRFDRVVTPDRKKVYADSNALCVDHSKVAAMSSAYEVETINRAVLNELPESSTVHPLMAILDNGYLTQPIHAVIAEERQFSGDSSSTSVGTTVSPVEVMAKNKQTGVYLFLIL